MVVLIYGGLIEQVLYKLFSELYQCVLYSSAVLL